MRKHLLKLKPWQRAALVGVVLFIASNVAYSLVLGGAPTMVKGTDGLPVTSDTAHTAEMVKKTLGAMSAVAFAYAGFVFVQAQGTWDGFVKQFKAAREQTRQVDSAEGPAQAQPMGKQTPANHGEVVDYPEDFESQEQPQQQSNQSNGWNDW